MNFLPTSILTLVFIFAFFFESVQSQNPINFNVEFDAQMQGSNLSRNFMQQFEDVVKNIFSNQNGNNNNNNNNNNNVQERRSLQQLYQAALREGNSTPLVVYSGGNARGQYAGIKASFERDFPGLTVNIVTDYSIYHGPRIDLQLANNSLVPDVVQLQTLQDFPRWKQQGHLLQYKPANFSKVYKEYRDEDGYYTGTLIQLISTMVSSQALNQSKWPRTAKDFLKPEFRKRLVIVYPYMDDFVLFYFKQIVDKYGEQYLAQLATQQPIYVCEGSSQFVMLGNGTATVAVSAFASISLGNSSGIKFAFPEDNDPFATYAVYAAIFKQTKRPETAKLYINWLLQKESPVQGAVWSVRTDVTPQNGYKPVWEYKNSNHTAFLQFMEDYEERTRFMKQVDLLLGPTKCDTSPLEASVSPRSQ